MPAILIRSVATPPILPAGCGTGCAVANSPVPPSVTQVGSAASHRLAPPQLMPSAASKVQLLVRRADGAHASSYLRRRRRGVGGERSERSCQPASQVRRVGRRALAEAATAQKQARCGLRRIIAGAIAQQCRMLYSDAPLKRKAPEILEAH